MNDKTLHNSDASGAQENVPDIEFFGDGDLWKLLSKASSQAEGWMKSTKAMEVDCGCLVQVTTQQRNLDGSYALAEAVTFVPGVAISEVLLNDEVVGRRLTAKSIADAVEEEAFAHPYGAGDGTLGGVIPTECLPYDRTLYGIPPGE